MTRTNSYGIQVSFTKYESNTLTTILVDDVQIVNVMLSTNYIMIHTDSYCKNIENCFYNKFNETIAKDYINIFRDALSKYLEDLVYHGDILDETEKNYLRNIIAPYRNKYRIRICKEHDLLKKKYFINIQLSRKYHQVTKIALDKGEGCVTKLPFKYRRNITLPHFSEDSKMYKNMKGDYPYTISELKL